MWKILEPYHAVVYFAPEAREHYAQAGLKGGWMGYFASRAAALGPVPAAVVVATFYNFHPRMVQRAIPDAWSFSTPERVLQARYEVADAALRRVLGDAVGGSEVRRAATLARRVTDACDPGGRPLHAAHASLAWPEEPHLVLWHAATLLREHRGDGHVATLVAEGIDGCAAHVLLVASGASTATVQREYRGWSEDDWAAAVGRLRDRGLVDDAGSFTAEGKRMREHIETRTDELAAPPYYSLTEDERGGLLGALKAIAATLDEGAAVPYPNPMGLPRS
jgi:hypothetical protein